MTSLAVAFAIAFVIGALLGATSHKVFALAPLAAAFLLAAALDPHQMWKVFAAFGVMETGYVAALMVVAGRQAKRQ